MRCKIPFRFRLWSSYSQAKKRRSASFGFNSYRTQFPYFWIIPMALSRSKMAFRSRINLWSKKKNSLRRCCRYVDRCPSSLCNIIGLPFSTSTHGCCHLSKYGGGKVVYLILLLLYFSLKFVLFMEFHAYLYMGFDISIYFLWKHTLVYVNILRHQI